ncbi:DUF2163 domain-containing protein [Variovorax sp. JS1663]|uniref:DUF2163 domain-containing protein n=1 Tax=Variovorax sp. JS1663 TaxID=1851577 RepID=UPI000B349A07|nr:DUF2163 domain-containing protein [Variovorax sp. JS1663]OUL98540.1 hypothetical protein A8M77_30940 [Variovorax sp. JS1663]
MSKTISVALKAHYALGSTTIARCWRFERRDGEVVTVTTCARDLLINSEVYRSKEGLNPTAISQEATAAVANSEVNGAMAAESVDEEELFAGLWDGAFVSVFEVNYRDLSMGILALQSGNIGDVKAGRTAFNAEVRGLTQSLQKVVGRVFTKGCPWKFGDPDTCRFDVEALRVTGSITSVTSLRQFTDSSRTESDDYFGAGVLTMNSGQNEGFQMEVYAYASDVFTLHLPLPFNPAIGDTYSVTPGCRKRWEEDCKTKWNNGNNFGGFPLVPGSDKVLGLGGTEGTNL